VIILIEYDYELIRKKENKNVKFHPDNLPKTLPNIVEIEGPNSAGKTTLLNIIALGLHGRDHGNIPNDIKREMNQLVNLDRHELTFNFSIEDSNGSLKLKAKKENKKTKDITLYEMENGKKIILTPESFKNKYNLIYVSPSNPKERINELLKEIQNYQNNIKLKVERFNEFIDKTIDEIKSKRNPEAIKEKEKKLNEMEKKLDKKKNEKKCRGELLDKLEKYTYSKFSQKYTDKVSEIEKEKKKLETNLENKDRTISILEGQYGKLIENANNTINECKKNHEKISELLEVSLPEDKKHHLNIWGRLSFDNIIKDLEISNEIDREIKSLKNVFRDIKRKDEFKEVKENIDMINGLIDYLKKYQDDIMVPGIDKKVSELVDTLKKENKKYKSKSNYVENIEKTLKLLDEMEDYIEELNDEIIPKIEKKRDKLDKEDLNEKYETKREKLSELEDKYQEYMDKFDYYTQEFDNKGLEEDNFEKYIRLVHEDEDLRDYVHYTEGQLRDEINDLKEKINNLDKDKSKLEAHIKINSEELKTLKSQEPHKFADKKEDLLSMRKSIRGILQKLDDFEDYIQKLDNDLISESDLEENELLDNYCKQLFSYLGKRIGYVRHIQEEYKVKKVDYIRKEIITEDEEDIKLDEMGTGEGQVAYLKGLLKSEKNRKLIGLFDEMAMIDEDNLERIYDILREMYKEGTLLTSIIVKGAKNKVNIESKVKGE